MIVPTFGRPAKAAACLARLAPQMPGQSEVLLGIDGGEDSPEQADDVERTAREAWSDAAPERLTIVRCRRQGQAAVRNDLLERARGRALLFLNDDVLPAPDLLEAHAAAQRAAQRAGRTTLIIGAAPWREHRDDRLFDRLVRETSMIFFYHRMDADLRTGAAGPDHDWGFRHAWLLNLSAPATLVRDAGGFSVFPATYGYEDDEFAFRCKQRFDAAVLYRPKAVAVHDHRMQPDEYLVRERRLGRAAWGFAEQAPECAHAMFGRDIRAEEELAYSRLFIERETAAVDRLRKTFHELASLPPDAAPDSVHPAGETLLRALYEQHLPLKRWEWRTGLLEAAAEQSPQPALAAVP